MKLALGAEICFAQSTIQTNGILSGGPLVADAGSGQPFAVKTVTGRPFTFQIRAGYSIAEDGQ